MYSGFTVGCSDYTVDVRQLSRTSVDFEFSSEQSDEKKPTGFSATSNTKTQDSSRKTNVTIKTWPVHDPTSFTLYKQFHTRPPLVKRKEFINVCNSCKQSSAIHPESQIP